MLQALPSKPYTVPSRWFESSAGFELLRTIMSSALLISPLLSPPSDVRATARIPSIADHGAQPSCSGVAQFSSSGRRKSLSVRHRNRPYPWLWNGDRRRRSVTAAAAAVSSEGPLFPFFSGPAQTLLTEIAGTLDKELGPYLHASQTPGDVRYFKSAEGNAEGSVSLRAGKGSKVQQSSLSCALLRLCGL